MYFLRYAYLFILLPLLVLSPACKEENLDYEGEPPLEKGIRHLGIHITTSQADDYDNDLELARLAGMDVVPLTIYWDSLESDTGYNMQVPALINQYYPHYKLPISLCISPISAASKCLPSDIANLPFDDKRVIDRFKALLDTLRATMPDIQLNNLIIGNEVDLYLNEQGAEAWAQYQVFYERIDLHAELLWGSYLQTGVEITYNTLIRTNPEVAYELNEYTDMVVLSYYPIDGQFQVKDPETALKHDFDELIKHYKDRPIFIEETGCPSSSLCGSSEQIQSDYVYNLFQIWDDYADHIVFVAYLWQTDLSDEDVNSLTASYAYESGVYREAFQAYLQTLGLRTYEGEDKRAYQELKHQARLRGW